MYKILKSLFLKSQNYFIKIIIVLRRDISKEIRLTLYRGIILILYLFWNNLCQVLPKKVPIIINNYILQVFGFIDGIVILIIIILILKIKNKYSSVEIDELYFKKKDEKLITKLILPNESLVKDLVDLSKFMLYGSVVTECDKMSLKELIGEDLRNNISKIVKSKRNNIVIRISKMLLIWPKLIAFSIGRIECYVFGRIEVFYIVLLLIPQIWKV
jgi:hypothetical protein